MHVSLCFFCLFKFTSVYINIVRLTARLTSRTRYTCRCRFVFRLLAFEYGSPLLVWRLERGIHTRVGLVFVCLSLQACPLLVWRLERGIHIYAPGIHVCHLVAIFLRLRRVKLLFTNWLPVNRVEFCYDGSWRSVSVRDGSPTFGTLGLL